MRSKALFFAILLLATTAQVFAADIYWISPSPSNWNNSANWSFTSGGSSCGCVPGAGDVVFFDRGNGNCLADIAPSAGAIQVAGYSGNIDLNGRTFTVGGLATNNFFNTGSFSNGLIVVTTTSAASLLGTYFAADVNLAITLTTATGIFTGGTGTIIDGNADVTAYSILLNGTVYNGDVTFTKTGNVNDLGDGGNTFSGVTYFLNNSSAILRTSNLTGDTFNSSVTFHLNASANGGYIQVAYGAGTSTTFNGNITVQSVNNSVNAIGINFGLGGGTSQLSEGFTISDDPTVDMGFERGAFELRNFTQGNPGSTTSQYLNIDYQGSPGSVAALSCRIVNSTFNASLTVESSNMDLNTSTFNGANNRFLKLQGGGDTNITGGNTFNGNVVFANEAGVDATTGGFMYIGSTSGNDFNGDLAFEYRNSFAKFYFAQHNSSDDITTISGNISVTKGAIGSTADESVFFCASNFGSVVLDGNANQTISVFTRRNSGVDYYYTFNLNNFVINKAGNVQFINVLSGGASAALLNPILVRSSTGDVTFTSGIVQPSATVFLNFLDGATAIGANDNSFVDGLVRKTGDDVFTFPVGDNGVYRPIAISAPATASSVFSASYTLANHGHGTSISSPLVIVSTCEYWNLTRETGTDNVSVTLSWNESVNCNSGSSYVTDPANLRVSRWGGSSWTDLGNGGTTGDATAGTVISSAAVTVFTTPFTLASLILGNVLPLEFTAIKAELKNNDVEIKWQTSSEINNDFFTVERYKDGLEGFEELGTVKGAGTSTRVSYYSMVDNNPVPGQLYYRIRQTDFSGHKTYSQIVGLFIADSDLDLDIAVPYPNPVTNNLFFDRLGFTDDAMLEIIDMTGRLIFRGKLPPVFDFENQPGGVYSIRLYTSARMHQYRILKK